MSSCSGTLCTNPQRRLSTQVSWQGPTLALISFPLKLLQWKVNLTNVNSSLWKNIKPNALHDRNSKTLGKGTI